jgi:ATP/maltotriose-dependent transcriptional regulator MalT
MLTPLIEPIERQPAGKRSQYLDAQILRVHAHLAHRDGDLEQAELRMKQAVGLLRELGVPFWMAVAELELAEWLVSWGRSDDATPLLSEARSVFEGLAARPWSERTDRVRVPSRSI